MMSKSDDKLRILNTLKTEDYLQGLLQSIRQHMDMDVAFIARFTDEERLIEFTSVDSSIVDPGIKPHDKAPLKQTYCQRIVSGELPELILDTQKNAITRDLPITRQLNIGAYIGVPILLDGSELYGTLCCYQSKSATGMDANDTGFLSVMADFIGRLLKMQLSADIKSNETRRELSDVIVNDKLHIAYQEITDLKGETIRHFEALARFDTVPYLPPNLWLSKAEHVGLSDALETMIVSQVLADLPQLKQRVGDCIISMNASPSFILSGKLHALLEGVSCDEVIIEVTEHAAIEDYAEFAEAIAPLVKRGFKVAVDDVGAGFSSLRHILELNASIIKLDRSLVCGIDTDNRKQALVAALMTFANMSSLVVVAEGIETKAELTQLQRLSVSRCQGYYFHYPTPLLELQ